VLVLAVLGVPAAEVLVQRLANRPVVEQPILAVVLGVLVVPLVRSLAGGQAQLLFVIKVVLSLHRAVQLRHLVDIITISLHRLARLSYSRVI
jgi:hypothetical protein